MNFTNTVVIMTSNIGSHYLLETNTEQQQSIEELVMAELRTHFKPELLNRVDDIIMFHALTTEHFHAIAWKYVGQLKERVAEQEIELKVSEEVVDWIVEYGIDPQFGARPLKRFIQRNVETAVARELLKGEVLPGETLHVTLDDNHQLIVTK